MTQQNILITGACGFIGSALAVELAKDHHVVGIDLRDPGVVLQRAAPHICWIRAHVGDSRAMKSAFETARGWFGSIDHVIHLAAYTNFGLKETEEYRSTNIQGTRIILDEACRHCVQRAAMEVQA